MNDSLREILITDVPPAFITRFLESAVWAYKDAWGRVSNDPLLTDDSQDYLLPHLRRVLLESKLQELALDCGLRAESKAVSSGAHKYVAVRVGRLVLTCSKTASPNTIARACEFRDQYSEINEHINQLNLFPVASTPGKESLYCIITHGPSEQKNDELGFCCFGFPSQDFKRWVQEPIPLADIRDYQLNRFQKRDDDRKQIQDIEPRLKPQFGADDATEESA